MDRWRGRVALVTGASSGIGRATATMLLSRGLNVVASDLHPEALESIRDEAIKSDSNIGELLTIKCDVSKEEDVLAMFARIKASKLVGVDICVNSAGVSDTGRLWEGETETWRKVLNVNVLGLSVCTREALRSMRERCVDDGHIVHIASIAAHLIAPACGFYFAAKHAVRALTEGLRQELLAEKSGIRVTEISPSFVKTAIHASMFGEDSATEFYASNYHLSTSDITAAVEHVLSAPKHVQVHDILIWPVGFPESK